jgi:arginase family enzyme
VMSSLRAKCPNCRTLTAVAIDDGYECHSCGATFRAGMVRVPRAWGDGGDAMVESASLDLPYPEAAVIEAGSWAEQNAVLADALPARPLVMGGCCCSHVGAVQGLAARHGRIAVVWFDAHGDLNTPESSPSGNEWGMPLRALIDDGTIRADDVALMGARSLDPPEVEFIEAAGVHLDDVGAALDGADAVYVALDVDVLDPEDEVRMFMPEPGGPSVAEVEEILRRVVEAKRLVGAGFTGVAGDPANVPHLTRFASAMGL